MNIFKTMHDAVMENDDDELKPSPKPIPVASAPAASSFSSMSSAAPGFAPTSFGAPTTPIVADDAVYQRVLAVTDFDKTATAGLIRKYHDALDGVPMDPNTKLKTALVQAGKIDGLTPDKVLGAFDQLTSNLVAEGDKFAAAVQGQINTEITGRQQQLQRIADDIAKKQQEIAQLQEQGNDISAKLAGAQASVTNAQAQFQLATQRRGSEITQQKAQFAALLH